MPFHRCLVLTIRSVFFCIIDLLMLVNVNLHAQIADTKLLQEKINQYNLTHPTQTLFVQTDKTTYTNNETIWFAAYLLRDVKESFLKPDILSVALVEESTGEIALQKKYLLEKNFCPGSLLLRDTVKPGNYELLAFTNLVNKKAFPLAVFRQSLTIKSIKDLTFSTNFTIADTSLTSDTLRIDVKVALPGVATELASFASIVYHLQEEQSKTLKLDVYGRGQILIPRIKIKQPRQLLFTTTHYKKEIQYFNLQLPPPAKEDSFNISFYPEGGDLVDGLQCRVAWEAKTNLGTAVQATAVLMKDGKITDTLMTSNNGIGVFSLVPATGSEYVLRLLANNKKMLWKDFLLPASLRKGVGLEIKNAISSDTLNVNIRSSINQHVSIAISNNDEGTVSIPIEINRERNIRLPLNKISKGVNTITILDEEGRPLAERLFFAHFDKKTGAILQTDKPAYKTREKISLGIQLTDSDSANIGGVFTIACTQNNRIESRKQKDIETYYYLGQFFEEPSLYTAGRVLTNKHILEDILLLKGWRKYTWQGIMQADASDTVGTIKKLVVKYQVFNNNHIVKKPVDLVMMRDSSFEMFTTDATGALSPDASAITVIENRKMFMRISGNNSFDYRVVSADSLEKTMLQYASHLSFHSTEKLLQLQTSLQQILSDQPKVKILKEVVITAQKKDDGFLAKTTNACGDYVCARGYLNCPYQDEPFSLPEKGKFYRVSAKIWQPYRGCLLDSEPSLVEVGNVYTARAFYGMDSTLLQQSTPEYMSTIYWNPFMLADDKGHANFSFYSSDIKGECRITVQGIGKNGEPFYSEKRIRVE
ncbi:MAG: hypothetical protein ABJB86_05670 [Bacteroidota bacterium]